VARRLTLCFACFVCFAASAAAQSLPDPTRPPGSTAGDAPDQGGGGLQSIIRPANGKGRARALIDGKIVHPGDMVGDARLVAIRANSVVLLHADGSREILTATPGVTKSPARNEPPARR